MGGVRGERGREKERGREGSERERERERGGRLNAMFVCIFACKIDSEWNFKKKEKKKEKRKKEKKREGKKGGGGGGGGLQSLKVGIYQLQSNEAHCSHSLEHNDPRSANAQSAHKGVNQRPKAVTQTQQQRPESPTVTLTWHASKFKVPKLHQMYK